ncbi:hypothetical protein A2W24_07020 [Microgenomates group bacterium RBG_16_45_19]|nr:MAG: hypothetical protein A2W24_07020 [Microgenomates group bacterium RBG_16_45_19]
MKVYFTASARGKRSFGKYYKEIYETIADLGNRNVDDLLFKIDASDLYHGSHEDQVKLYKSALEHIQNSDVVVLELSVHSLSMGCVMHKALDIGKPVIALFLSKHEPYFALGIDDEKLQVVEYDGNNLRKQLKLAFKYSEEQMDTRFNFFISPKIGAYLDWVSRIKRVPRAVYLRKLILDDMKHESDYEG